MRKKTSCLNQSADKGYQSRTMRFAPQPILCGVFYHVLIPIILTPIIRLGEN